jgi:1,2-diacylglycerol 3-beta-galactosyltransferase
MINLQELLDSIDWFRKLTGIRLQDLYNLMLRKGWTLGSTQLVRGMHLVIRAFHSQQVALLRNHWRTSPPDLVVSLIPNFNRALRQSLGEIPFATVLTDLADYPPHFWMERESQYLICGSDRAVKQALALGHKESHIFRVSGMILNPDFYQMKLLTPEERAAEQMKIGFDPKLPIGLVLFGGQGAEEMYDIARRLSNRQLLLICGRNDKLKAKVSALPRAAATFVQGFTTEVPRYMQLADYFIGKPGPGSISEAVQMRLPVIVQSNAWTLPQERFNAEWIREQGVGMVLPDFRGVAEAVETLLEPPSFANFRSATERLENRAVFEIPRILDRLLAISSRKTYS